MSPKAKKPAAKPSKAPASVAKQAKAEKSGKSASAKAAPIAVAAAAPAPSDNDDSDEEESAAQASSGGGGGNAAAIAAASGGTEMSASFKNFRHHPDMENFYRFIHDNDLRIEARTIIDQMLAEKATRKAVKLGKSQAH